MINSANTSPEWRERETSILMLPVGSLEQHSEHLPLATDTIQCEHIASRVAEQLDAALLPVLPISTSMEHTGFPGSFSLRPETLMQVVRDLADEAEAQDFRIMIVLNAHGGNHALVPVCRDINRRDRALKIILLDIFRCADRSLLQPDDGSGRAFHAGECETSMMLSIAPGLVKPARPHAPRSTAPLPLRQEDLTTFGIGHISPTGIAGDSRPATPEKGAAIIDSITDAATTLLKSRIIYLQEHPTYFP